VGIRQWEGRPQLGRLPPGGGGAGGRRRRTDGAVDSARAPLPEWFVPFFSVSAGLIATLFIALTLGARQIQVKVWMAWLTVVYVGLGEVAAVAGLSAALPRGVYAYLIGVTVGAGIGALLNSMIIGGRAIADDEAARRKAWGEEIRKRTLPDAPDAPPPV
jgi:hypothetical protein